MHWLIKKSPQRWQYLRKLENDVLIASIETTVQSGHALVTIEEGGDLTGQRASIPVGPEGITDDNVHSLIIETMTLLSYQIGKKNLNRMISST